MAAPSDISDVTGTLCNQNGKADATMRRKQRKPRRPNRQPLDLTAAAAPPAATAALAPDINSVSISRSTSSRVVASQPRADVGSLRCGRRTQTTSPATCQPPPSHPFSPTLPHLPSHPPPQPNESPCTGWCRDQGNCRKTNSLSTTVAPAVAPIDAPIDALSTAMTEPKKSFFIPPHMRHLPEDEVRRRLAIPIPPGKSAAMKITPLPKPVQSAPAVQNPILKSVASYAQALPSPPSTAEQQSKSDTRHQSAQSLLLGATVEDDGAKTSPPADTHPNTPEVSYTWVQKDSHVVKVEQTTVSWDQVPSDPWMPDPGASWQPSGKPEKRIRKRDRGTVAFNIYNELMEKGPVDPWTMYERTGFAMPDPEIKTHQRGRNRWPKRNEPPALGQEAWERFLQEGEDSADEDDVDIGSDSEGDPFYDIKKITDWKGDFLPPPECWAERVKHTKRHPYEDIMRWMGRMDNDCIMLMDTWNKSAFTSPLRGTLTKEIAPKCWVPLLVDGEPVQKYFRQLSDRVPQGANDEPETYSLHGFWDRYECQPPDDYFLAPPKADCEEVGIDDTDADNELWLPYCLISINERLSRLNRKMEEKERKRQAKLNRPLAWGRRSDPAPDPSLHRQLRPAANMYIRPIQPADVVGIVDIYNLWVNTIHTTEFEPCTLSEIRERCNRIVTAKLPFFVAVAKRNRAGKKFGYVSERIIGYASLRDHADQSSMHRYTFDMDLFVHPDFLRQGIGRCLLDKMIDYAHPNYPARRGYEYINEFDYLSAGERRVIKSILVDYHYEMGTNVDWVTKYLKEFGFSRAGHFHKIGYKDGKVVDKSMFQIQTSENINPAVPPTVLRAI